MTKIAREKTVARICKNSNIPRKQFTAGLAKNARWKFFEGMCTRKRARVPFIFFRYITHL